MPNLCCFPSVLRPQIEKRLMVLEYLVTASPLFTDGSTYPCLSP